MAEKKTTKKKTKPMPVAVAAALIVIAVALMASFVYYVIKPPKDASAGGDYSGTQDFGEQSENEYNLELGELKDDIKDAEVHDIISLGKYEQDGNTENGNEDIEWIVLEKNDETVLLISRYALDTVKFNENREECSFEESDLFEFLNGDFYNNSFDDDEKNVIFSNENGEKISLPTKEEVFKYMAVDETHVDSAKITSYAESKGARTRNGVCWWWLKDGGNAENSAKYVHFDGTVQDNGFAFDYGEVAVRPVLRVKIG